MLIEALFLDAFRNPLPALLEDQAVFRVQEARMAFTTDSFVVSPLFFPGGNIGDLAVNGTVNDLVVSGARPLYLSAEFILEEGFPVSDLQGIVHSMATAAAAAGVSIVTGDTKNEVAKVANVSIVLDECAIPVRTEVRGACEMLGIDPLYVACEGRLLALVDAAAADMALAAMCSHPLGKGAAIIGTVAAEPPALVLLKTQFGGTRIVDMLVGDPLPRIC